MPSNTAHSAYKGFENLREFTQRSELFLKQPDAFYALSDESEWPRRYKTCSLQQTSPTQCSGVSAQFVGFISE